MWTRWDDIDRMFGVMDQLHNKWNRLNADLGRSGSLSLPWEMAENSPRSNLYDLGDHLEMRLELPGFAKEDLRIKVQGNYLEISGIRKSDAPEGYTAHRVERGISSFCRSFTLPADMDTSKVQAQLRNGILLVTLPKSETAKPKQIAIN